MSIAYYLIDALSKDLKPYQTKATDDKSRDVMIEFLKNHGYTNITVTIIETKV